MTSSLIEPLTPLIVIKTKDWVLKFLTVGNQLLLGGLVGYLQVVDINNYNITSTHKFTEGRVFIHDIVAIDQTHFLIAT